MRRLAARLPELQPPHEPYAWMDGDFAELRSRFGRVTGVRLPTPRLIRAALNAASLPARSALTPDRPRH